MTAETIHTCSYECERPECIRAQRDELAARMTAETSNARGEVVAWFPTNAQGEIIRNYGDGSPVYACRTKEEAEQAKRCHLGATGPVIPLYAAPPPAAAQQGQAVAECHCATCTCAPGMTPAVRFDASPAAQEGAVRDHLIALGWTPPGAQQPAPPNAPVGVEAAGITATELGWAMKRATPEQVIDYLDDDVNMRVALEMHFEDKQPAAVDGAMLRKLRDYFEGINNDEDGDDYRNLSADAMDLIDSALAAQRQEPTT